MTVNDNKSYLSYLNRLIYEGNNSYHYCIGKKTINADYTALTEEIGTYSKLPKFNVGNLKTVPIYLKSRLVDKSCKQKQCLRN